MAKCTKNAPVTIRLVKLSFCRLSVFQAQPHAARIEFGLYSPIDILLGFSSLRGGLIDQSSHMIFL
jgi:hypothetical protein